MKIKDKVLTILFPPYKRILATKESKKILYSILNMLPSKYDNLKLQISQIRFFGFSEWREFPEYQFVNFSYPNELYKKFKISGRNYKISGIEIFSKKTNQFQSAELLFKNNLLVGFKILDDNSNVGQLEINKIETKNCKESKFEFPLDEFDILYKSLGSNIKELINPDDFIEVEHNNKMLYGFFDLEDGNYLAIDKNQQVYSLIHDAKPIAKKIKSSFEELLIEIRKNRFDRNKHLEERYNN